MTYLVLKSKDRMTLQNIICHSHDAHQVVRAYALLWLDDGDSIQEIAHRLRLSRQSIYNWAHHYQQGEQLDLESLLSAAPHSGRPCTAKGIIDPIIDRVIDTDPHKLGYRSTVWTAPLLVTYLRDQHQIAVSADSVSLAIKRLGIRWKRPRPNLALRPATWRQAKGG